MKFGTTFACLCISDFNYKVGPILTRFFSETTLTQQKGEELHGHGRCGAFDIFVDFLFKLSLGKGNLMDLN